jgi:hypothetical protein
LIVELRFQPYRDSQVLLDLLKRYLGHVRPDSEEQFLLVFVELVNFLMSTPSFYFELFHSARAFGFDGGFTLGLMPSSECCLPISQRFLFISAYRISNPFVKFCSTWLVQLVFEMGDCVSIRLPPHT